jgi:hypothetical protein
MKKLIVNILGFAVVAVVTVTDEVVFGWVEVTVGTVVTGSTTRQNKVNIYFKWNHTSILLHYLKYQYFMEYCGIFYI